MKKLAVLLAAVIIIGIGAAFMLEEHADMQNMLSTSYEEKEETEDETESEAPEEPKSESLNVEFSQKRTFYDEDIDVELFCGDGKAVIYYTLDGNTPDENSSVYTEAIHLGAQKEENCTTIKAFAVKGENKSDIAVRSYIVGRNISERFDEDMLVFVLSADEYDLYDYYNGIAVEGYLRDEYKRTEYTGGEIKPTAPANYNIRGRESERPMYVEIYNGSGDKILAQAAGARVVGGYSRAVDQKSWRLIARKQYEPGKGKFAYPLFTGNTDGYGDFVIKYDRITLRNGANDREFAGVRDELSAVLANDAGFLDTQAVRPAAVYLNGKYYGFAWLHEAYCEDYLEMMYGGSKDNFRIIGSEELEMESDNEEDQQALSDWAEVIALAESGLKDDRDFERFCELVDMDDLILYYAMQIYIDNKDWPGNNFKVWRYYPSEGEVSESPYLDGKWRFLFFDAEYAWGLYGNGYGDDTLRAVLTGNHMQGASHILGALLERDDMKSAFAAAICEIEAGAFSEANVKKRLDELITVSESEQKHALEKGITSHWANEWSIADSRNQITQFAERRGRVIDRSITKNLGYTGEKYTVNIKAPTGSKIKLGSVVLDPGESISVPYFEECAQTLTADVYNGYSFVYWTVNGDVRAERTLTIDKTCADTDGIAEIELYLEKTEKSGTLAVSRLVTAGSADSFDISNSTDGDISIQGWHLSDKASKLDKFTIPNITVPAGGSVTFVLEDNKDPSSLSNYQTSFSLKIAETLYFSDRDMNIISAVPVLDLDEGKYLELGEDGKYHIK